MVRMQGTHKKIILRNVLFFSEVKLNLKDARTDENLVALFHTGFNSFLPRTDILEKKI